MIRGQDYMREFFMVSVAASSTLYSPLAVKKSRSVTSSGQTPSAILIIHRNYNRSIDEPPEGKEIYLIDIISGISQKTTKNNKDIIHIVLS